LVKDLVDRARAPPCHRAFGDKLYAGRSRQGVVSKVAVEQVVVRPRRAADGETVLPVHSVARAESSQDIVTISKPPLGLGVGKVEVFGDSDEGTREGYDPEKPRRNSPSPRQSRSESLEPRRSGSQQAPACEGQR
jgi:hypothetical protein